MIFPRATFPKHRPLVRRFFVGVVFPVIPLLLLLPLFANAQRVASIGSRLQRRFGGSGSGSVSYVVEQGEDGEESCDDNNWMSSMMHVFVERPGMLAVGSALLMGYLFFLWAQERVSEIERKLHQNLKRQDSAGEFLGSKDVLYRRQNFQPRVRVLLVQFSLFWTARPEV
jgi:hypothetical protein